MYRVDPLGPTRTIPAMAGSQLSEQSRYRHEYIYREWTQADHPCYGRIPAVRTIQVYLRTGKNLYVKPHCQYIISNIVPQNSINYTHPQQLWAYTFFRYPVSLCPFQKALCGLQKSLTRYSGHFFVQKDLVLIRIIL